MTGKREALGGDATSGTCVAAEAEFDEDVDIDAAGAARIKEDWNIEVADAVSGEMWRWALRS